jgi:hypothetical protein
MKAYDKDGEIRVELDQLVESIRIYSWDIPGDSIKFALDRAAAVEKLAAYLRKNYERKDPPAFVSIGSST